MGRGSGAAQSDPDAEEARLLDAASAPTDPPPARAGSVGQVVANKYRLLDKIGEGGMGAVYEAEHVHTRRRVALKMLLDERTRPSDSARFMREARAASQIGHPGIVEVLDAGYHRGSPYLVLELLRGETLEEALEENRLTFGELRGLMLQVLDALHAAHEVGIVHRDIKPENIFVESGPDGLRAKLLDFGIAKTVEGLDTKLTVTGTVMGTPTYMSPEQAAGKVVDRRSDLWSVAASLYHAVVGRPPFRGDNYNILIARILTQEPPDIRERHPTLPESFAATIASGLQREVDGRVGTAAAMADLLRKDDGIAVWGDLPCTARDLSADRAAQSGIVTQDASLLDSDARARALVQTDDDPGRVRSDAPLDPDQTDPIPSKTAVPVTPAGKSRGPWIAMVAAAGLVAVGVAAAAWQLGGDPGAEVETPSTDRDTVESAAELPLAGTEPVATQVPEPGASAPEPEADSAETVSSEAASAEAASAEAVSAEAASAGPAGPSGDQVTEEATEPAGAEPTVDAVEPAAHPRAHRRRHRPRRVRASSESEPSRPARQPDPPRRGGFVIEREYE